MHPPFGHLPSGFFFRAFRISIPTIPLYLTCIGPARSAMATAARTTRQPKSKRLESPHSWPVPLHLGVCWVTLVSLRFSNITALCPPYTLTVVHTLCYFLRRHHPPGCRPSLCVSASLTVFCIRMHKGLHLKVSIGTRTGPMNKHIVKHIVKPKVPVRLDILPKQKVCNQHHYLHGKFMVVRQSESSSS